MPRLPVVFGNIWSHLGSGRLDRRRDCRRALGGGREMYQERLDRAAQCQTSVGVATPVLLRLALNALRQFNDGVAKAAIVGLAVGSRSKLGEAFVADLHADWQQHGPAVIEQVRKFDPATYLRLIASLMPRKMEADVSVGVFHDATSILEAFRMASELTGADPDRALRRLRRHAPHLIDHDEG